MSDSEQPVVYTNEQVNDLLERLTNVPMRLSYAVIGWPEAYFTRRPPSDTWSAHEIMAHLRASYDILSHRVFAVLMHETPAMPSFDDQYWARLAYHRLTFRTSLSVFATLHAELIGMLHHLPLTVWSRAGIHDVHGRMTVYDIVKYIVEHEEEHCEELEHLAEIMRPSRHG